MTLKDIFTGQVGKNNMDRKVFSLLTTLIVILALFLAAGFLFPETVSVILNIVWIILMASAAVFFTLGILVIVGMKREAGRVLDLLLEGALTFIDFLEFLKNLWKRFIDLLKEFLLFAAPIFAYIAAFLVYVLLLYIYKTVGKSYDVMIMTIIITAAAIMGFGLLSKPQPDTIIELTWNGQFQKKFKAGFIDGIEVVLFIFFLTMDSTNLFFLPTDLNIPLKAEFKDYDLMLKSFVYDKHVITTIALIVTTVSIEVLRNMIKVFASARKYYLNFSHELENFGGAKRTTMDMLKEAIRKSFNDAKRDLIKFVTFNTVLFAVFLLFPRLKLLTLAVASVTNLGLDLSIRSRLTAKKGSDLISRILQKVFRL